MRTIRPFLFLLAIVVFSGSLTAQQLYFCKGVTDKGDAIGPNKYWLLSAKGGNITILYHHNGKINTNRLIFDIYKKNISGKYTFFDGKEVIVNPNKHYAAIEYFFEKPGEYRVVVLTPNEKKLTQADLTVELDLKNPGGVTGYDQSQILFCEKLLKGKPEGVSYNFKLGKNEGKIIVYINNNNPFNTEQLIVDVYKYTGSGNAAKSVETLYLDVNPNWETIHFEYQFQERGRYLFDIWDQNEVWVNSAEVTIE